MEYPLSNLPLCPICRSFDPRTATVGIYSVCVSLFKKTMTNRTSPTAGTLLLFNDEPPSLLFATCLGAGDVSGLKLLHGIPGNRAPSCEQESPRGLPDPMALKIEGGPCSRPNARTTR